MRYLVTPAAAPALALALSLALALALALTLTLTPTLTPTLDLALYLRQAHGAGLRTGRGGGGIPSVQPRRDARRKLPRGPVGIGLSVYTMVHVEPGFRCLHSELGQETYHIRLSVGHAVTSSGTPGNIRSVNG